MDFMTATRTGLSKLSDMSGKATRPEFWWYFLAVVIIGIVVNIVLNIILDPFVASAVGQIVSIVLLFSVTVRRLADAGRPAFWAYIFFGLGLLSAIAMLIPGLTLVVPFLGIISLILLIVMIYFLVQPSAGGAA
jgi:uncharacterized membrane protein YhaH (DUF805 family)